MKKQESVELKKKDILKMADDFKKNPKLKSFVLPISKR